LHLLAVTGTPISPADICKRVKMVIRRNRCASPRLMVPASWSPPHDRHCKECTPFARFSKTIYKKIILIETPPVSVSSRACAATVSSRIIHLSTFSRRALFSIPASRQEGLLLPGRPPPVFQTGRASSAPRRNRSKVYRAL